MSNLETSSARSMQRYICEVCGYIYDPAEGNPDNGVAAGTAFADLPSGWDCPRCGAPVEEFRAEEQESTTDSAVGAITQSYSQNLEISFVLLKPDAVQRALLGEILSRLERCGLRIVAMKMLRASKSIVEEHYIEHRGKDFFPSLVEFMNGKTVLILAVEGAAAIRNIRKLVGSTEPANAAPGTIRGDFCHMDYARADHSLAQTLANVVHASDSRESAERELALWFSEQDFCYSVNPRCDQPFM